MPRKSSAAQPDLFAALPDQGVCGVDEAGRGPLAGSVFTGAVILDPARPINGLRDSKQLTEARREALAEQIRERALAWAVASASVDEIDRLNILQATLLAMRRAVLALQKAPALVLVDGNRLPELPMEARAIVKGDALVPAISAASILAKCARDAEARELHAAYPGYGFDLHKGYGTELHMTRLQTLGACPAHRASFAPVREALERAGVAPSAW